MDVIKLLKFSNQGRLPMLLQTEVAECGLACVGMVAGFYGYNTDLLNLRQRFKLSLKGATLEKLIKVSDQLKMDARPIRLELEDLKSIQLPAILHWDFNHYVVLKKVSAKHIWINDPAKGECKLTFSEISKHFTGVALELTPQVNFKKNIKKKTMRLLDFFSQVSGLKNVIFQVFILSLLLQVFALSSPFLMQIIMDDIIVSEDLELLWVVSLAFLLLSLITQATSLLRSLVLLHLSNQLSAQMTSNLFHHLLRLPLNFFENRHLGDIITRFGSLSSLQSFLSTGIVAVVLDGIMAIATLILMFIYLSDLAWIAVATTLIYLMIRVLSYVPFRRLNEEQMIASAKESSNFMESIRGIQSIKIFGKEVQRKSLWQNFYADSINTGIRTAKFGLIFEVSNGVLFAVENILIIYLGAKAVIAGTISVGMFLAFLAYKGQFAAKASALIDMFFEFKMLNLHLERIADIGMTEMEKGMNEVNTTKLTGQLELKNITFRYDETQPYLFENINYTFHANESIAITGSSGVGKTTLLKIMIGLFKSDQGKIEDNGRSLTNIGLSNYRNQISAVMQDDQLMSGSIMDNICFFSTQPDIDWLEKCAKLASIHDEILQMPMGYNSLVGDMGTSLSGGQKQRILLARALYKKPKILFMDEATSHLDTTLEAKVNYALNQLDITRIIIAHRPETINNADKILLLKDKKLIEMNKQ